MKKFFAYLLFSSLILVPHVSFSGVQNVSEPSTAFPVDANQRNKDLEKLFQEIPNLEDKEAVAAYVQKRLSIATAADISPEDLATPTSTSIVSKEEIENKQKNTLSAYEQIYSDSMQKAASSGALDEGIELKGTFYRPKTSTDYMPFVPDFPYVTIKLSDNREILAPAEEHIAYMLTTIKIEPTGLLRVTEEFVFVSNNEGFPTGFFRIFPKYTRSLENEERRLDFTLDSVTINGEEHPYKITEIGNYLHIEPKVPLELPTGVYTYRFNYLIDRAVWSNEETDELYWDITSRTIQNVIGSTNAVVILPTGKTFMGQNAFVNTKSGPNLQRVTITTLSENSLGFADTEALDVGEDIHLLIQLEKDIIVAPDFAKRYLWFIHDCGAVLFAILALVAIFISYKISSTQLRRNQDKTRVNLKKTPALFRLINKNIFDARSFGAEILNLCSKNILELRAKDETTVLFKKTDDIKKLTKTEQQLLKTLFPNAETSLEAAPEATLKLQRAYRLLKNKTTRRFELYKLQLNSLYLLFSISMLLCGIIGAASISVNPVHTFWVITICTLLISISMVILYHKFRNKYIDLLIKALMASEVLGLGGFMAIYTSRLYAVIIILSIAAIISYYRLFSLRSGLLRNKIKETEEYKNALSKNIELTQKSKDFPTKIPYIFAYELDNNYQGIEIFTLINNLLQHLQTNNKRSK